MRHYVGGDVGLRSSSLCIVDEQGQVCLEREVASEIDQIAAAIRGFAEHVDGVALETGNLTPWLTTGLRAEGFRVVVMEARHRASPRYGIRHRLGAVSFRDAVTQKQTVGYPAQSGSYAT